MISIISFLGSEDRLVPIEEVDEYDGDLDYIEGALVLEVDGRELMSRRQWDYIDQLWYLFLDAVHQAVVNVASVEFMYPDEPVPVKVDATNGRTFRLQVGRTSITVDKTAFASCLLAAARHFHRELARLIGEPEVASFEALINEVEEALRV